MNRYYVTCPPGEKVLSQFGCFDCKLSFRGRLGWAKIAKHAKNKHSEPLTHAMLIGTIANFEAANHGKESD